MTIPKIEKANSEWNTILSPMEYHILREAGTERSGTGLHLNETRIGKYFCIACNTPLFTSDTKFDAGCGWPSFFEAISPDAIETQIDHSGGRTRTEIRCAGCNGHLGHVFPDGPPPTGLRYCLNGTILKFVEG